MKLSNHKLARRYQKRDLVDPCYVVRGSFLFNLNNFKRINNFDKTISTFWIKIVSGQQKLSLAACHFCHSSVSWSVFAAIVGKTFAFLVEYVVIDDIVRPDFSTDGLLNFTILAKFCSLLRATLIFFLYLSSHLLKFVSFFRIFSLSFKNYPKQLTPRLLLNRLLCC